MAVRSAADRHGYWQPVFTRDIDDRVEVEGAGPRILVAGELLRELAYAHVPGGEPFVFLPGTELELPYPAEVYRVIESRAGFGAFWVKASAAAAAGIPDRIQVVPGPAGAEVWADAFIGGVLRIRVVTGNLVYKITGFDFAHRAYIAEWPPS